MSESVFIPQALIFDRIYPNLYIAKNNADKDGVAEGRYVLIDSKNYEVAYANVTSNDWPGDYPAPSTTANIRTAASVVTTALSWSALPVLQEQTNYIIPLLLQRENNKYVRLFEYTGSAWETKDITDSNNSSTEGYEIDLSAADHAIYKEFNNSSELEAWEAHDGEIYQKSNNQYIFIGNIMTSSQIDAIVSSNVALYANGGLKRGSGGIYVDTDIIATKDWVSANSGTAYIAGPGININNNTITLKDLYAIQSPFYCDDNGYLQLSYDINTLETYIEDKGNGDKYYLNVKIDSANGGITSSANGLYIDTTWLSSHVSGGNETTYTGGTGITVNNNNVIAMKLNEELSPIYEFNNQYLTIRYDNTLKQSSDGNGNTTLGVKLDSVSGGLTSSANGITVSNNYYTSAQVEQYVSTRITESGNFDSTSYYTSAEVNTLLISTYAQLNKLGVEYTNQTPISGNYYYTSAGEFKKANAMNILINTTVGAELTTLNTNLTTLGTNLGNIIVNRAQYSYNENSVSTKNIFYLNSNGSVLYRGTGLGSGTTGYESTTVGEELTGLLNAKDVIVASDDNDSISVSYPLFQWNGNNIQIKNSGDTGFSTTSIAKQIRHLYSQVPIGITTQKAIPNTQQQLWKTISLSGGNATAIGTFVTINKNIQSAGAYISAFGKNSQDVIDVTADKIDDSSTKCYFTGFSSWENSMHLQGAGILSIDSAACCIYIKPMEAPKLFDLPATDAQVTSVICGYAHIYNNTLNNYYPLWLLKHEPDGQTTTHRLYIEDSTNVFNGTYNIDFEMNFSDIVAQVNS